MRISAYKPYDWRDPNIYKANADFYLRFLGLEGRASIDFIRMPLKGDDKRWPKQQQQSREHNYYMLGEEKIYPEDPRYAACIPPLMVITKM